jgi:DSF synthase
MRVFANESSMHRDQHLSGDPLALLKKLRPANALEPSSPPAPVLPHLQPFSRTYTELELSLDYKEKTLWMRWQPKGPPSVTLALLNDLNIMHRDINKMFANQKPHEEQPFLFYAAISKVKGIFNLGGDLAFFLDKIRHHDRNALLTYANACVDAVYNNAFGFDVPIVTIGVVEGDALGGGLECALSFNVLIAERGAKMGFPEVLFNSFPGMGAFSFLARKLGPTRAKKIIMSGRVYSAEEFYEIGLVDVLANKGEAREAAQKFIAENKRRHTLLYAMNKVQNKVNMLTKSELQDVTEIWVDSVLKLDAQDLRRMELLISAQQRRGT